MIAKSTVAPLHNSCRMATLGAGRELRPWESGCLGDRRKWLLQKGGHYEEIGCNNYITDFIFCRGGGATFLIISNTVKIYQLN